MNRLGTKIFPPAIILDGPRVLHEIDEYVSQRHAIDPCLIQPTAKTVLISKLGGFLGQYQPRGRGLE
jgi:hypothetical protein